MHGGTFHLTPALNAEKAARKFASNLNMGIIATDVFQLKSLKFDFVL